MRAIFILFSCLLLWTKLVSLSGAAIRLPIKSVVSWPSSSGTNVTMAVDSSLTSVWISNPCKAGAWVLNPEFNILYGVCTSQLCTSTCNSSASSLMEVTDGKTTNSRNAWMNEGIGSTWAKIPVATGSSMVKRVYIRGSWPWNTTLSIVRKDGSQKVISNLNPLLNYQDVNIDLTNEANVKSFSIQSNSRDGVMRGYCYAGIGDCKTMSIFELAARSKDCYEQLTLDLGSVNYINRLLFQSSGFVGGSIYSSIDGQNFFNRSSLSQFASKNTQQTLILGNVAARYVRFRYVTSAAAGHDWDKVYVQDIEVFGNPAGASLKCPNNCSFVGTCNTLTGICQCNSLYAGVDCSYKKCSSPCLNNGVCVNGLCVCSNGYSGSACEAAVCPNDCYGRGQCVAPGVCACAAGFGGSDCRKTVFYSVNSGKSARNLLVDYPLLAGNKSAVKPAARTSFYQSQFGACAGSSLPFRCSDGSCALSVGACSLRIKNGNAGTKAWSSTNYDTKTIPVAGFFASSASQYAYNVGDGSQSTFWQSGICFATGYVSVPVINIIANACAAGRCTISTTTGTLSTATATSPMTDMNFDTPVSALFNSAAGKGYVQISFSTSTNLIAVSAKTNCGGPVLVMGVVSGTNTKMLIGTIPTTSNYQAVNFEVVDNSTLSGKVFSGIWLESSWSGGFQVFELAARSGPCYEFAGIDFGKPVAVSALTVRHYAGTGGTVTATYYESSLDQITWQGINTNGPIPSITTDALDVEIYPAVLMRYVRVRHVLQEKASFKVFVWELSAWDTNGKNGQLGTVKPNPVSFRKLVGVNGIYGWGTGSYSSTLTPQLGPSVFSPACGHARNYQNWNWDVSDPTVIPAFDQMVAPGSSDYGALPGSGSRLNFNWLNWDNEYTAWKASGMEVEVSVQFSSSSFPQNLFKNPFVNGYNYGYFFSRHFGRKNGTGDVASMEVGNEPWIAGMGYSDPVFYSTLLMGMAKGAKDGDPTMRVLPAHFGSLSDNLQRFNASHIRYLDALNVHAYSWMQTLVGRTGVHPEHNMSTQHEVNDLIRFRDTALPGMPIYLTEWGWDSAGGGEDCNPPAGISGTASPVCVSEAAQALYAVRGALMLARKGLQRLTWFFYGNQATDSASWPSVKGLFSRSGLRSTSAAGYQLKQSYYALKDFIASLGTTNFQAVIREDHDAFVYLLANGTNLASHIMAWRPVDAGVSGSINVTFTVCLPCSGRCPSACIPLWLLSVRKLSNRTTKASFMQRIFPYLQKRL